MANTISDFKSGFNGGTRANRFSVDFTWPTDIPATVFPKNTSYHAIAAKLPESELGSISIPYRGRVAHFAGDRDYKPWNVTFLDDTGDNAAWHAFQSWSNILSSHINNIPKDQTYAKDDTLATIKFTQLRDPTQSTSNGIPSITSNKSKTVTLYHAWPSEVGQIGFDMGEGGSLITYTVTFTYDYYTIAFNNTQ